MPEALISTKSKPKTADWDLAQALFLQGVPWKTICQQAGCSMGALNKRSTRKGWKKQRDTAIELRGQALATASVHSLTQQSTKIREALADEAEDTAVALRKIPVVGTLAHLDQRSAVASKIAGTAGRALNWNSGENIAKSVDLNILGNVTINVLPVARDTEPEPEAIPISATVTTEQNPSPGVADASDK